MPTPTRDKEGGQRRRERERCSMYLIGGPTNTTRPGRKIPGPWRAGRKRLFKRQHLLLIPLFNCIYAEPRFSFPAAYKGARASNLRQRGMPDDSDLALREAIRWERLRKMIRIGVIQLKKKIIKFYVSRRTRVKPRPDYTRAFALAPIRARVGENIFFLTKSNGASRTANSRLRISTYSHV